MTATCCVRCEAEVAGERADPLLRMVRRMVVCPDCGNKRCPRASDHRLACSGSNEPGQPGSVYSQTVECVGSDTVPAGDAETLLRRLVADVGDNPWSWSTEGLDDCCTFCGAYEVHYKESLYVHRPDCVWFDIHDFLGLTVHADHIRSSEDVL